MPLDFFGAFAALPSQKSLSELRANLVQWPELTQMQATPIHQRFIRPLYLLLFLGAGLFLTRLGTPGLMDPDEGRYAEIAREMLVTGDFITPQLNFLPYLEKPPLVYWLTALSLQVGGLNEWAARLIPALSALAALLAVYWLAVKLWEQATAFLAALATATSSGFFLLGRLLTLDMTLTACLTWGVALAYVAVRNQQPRYLPWAYLALALGMMTKGLVAVVLPALIFLAWFALQKQWRGLLTLWHTGGILLFAVVVLPWHFLVAWHNPDFLQYFLFREHLQRFLAPHVHAGKPVFFYLGVLVAGFLPWVFLLPWAWRRTKTEPAANQDRLFLSVWFAVIFIFFTLARAKLFPYLLPGLPPLALLVGRALSGTFPAPPSLGPLWFWSLRLWVATTLLILLGWLVAAFFVPALWERIAFLSFYPAAAALILAIPPAAGLTGRLTWPRWRSLLLGSALALNLVLIFAVERVATIKSPKMLAQMINARTPADGVLIGFHYYSQGISFYTSRPFYLFQTKGELEFGLEHKPGNPYYLHWPADLSALLASSPVFFVVIHQDNVKFLQTMYNQPLAILAPWKNILLISNH